MAPLLNVRWQTSYERSSVDQFLAAVDAERRHLEEEIEAAKARLRRVRELAAVHAAATAEITERLLRAQRELEVLEREHRRALDGIDAEASEVARRLMAAAREEAAAMRAAAALALGMTADRDPESDHR